MFKIYEYFSEICLRAFAIADALSEITAINFFGPIADNTRSISFSRRSAVCLTADKSRNEYKYSLSSAVIIKL